MRDRLEHRGPDACGLYVSPTGAVGLGFRRLKIVDLSDSANQPLSNEDGTVHVVFNGEIYNFRELRRALQAKEHQFRTTSDTEVIVHLYEDELDRCVDHLDGMFALAIWDERRQQLVLARDRAGKKPLFYHSRPSRLTFASEIKAFFGRDDFAPDINRAAIPQFFLHGYVPCPDTLYDGVDQLEPGTVLTVQRDGSRFTRRFWSIDYPRGEDVSVDDALARGRVRTLLAAAVERRLIADVPLGAFLSGGLDSAIIVGLMSQLAGTSVKTFSIGFKDNPAYDETAYARQVARHFNTAHTEFIVEPNAFDLMEKLVWHHDGPFADSSAIPTYIVSALTKPHATVVLTGDGGDELFGGYRRFQAALAATRIPSTVRQVLERLERHVPSGYSERHLLSRLKRFACAAAMPLERSLISWAGLVDRGLEELVAPSLGDGRPSINRLQCLNRVAGQLQGLSAVNTILAINFNTYLLDDLLVKTDRCTMASSLEARSPFLDTELVEYVARLPDHLKFDARRTKVVLREAFADLVPRAIQHRPKMGFGVPLAAWFRGPLRESLEDLLRPSSARYREFLSSQHVHRVIAEHLGQVRDHGHLLWTLLTFETWLRALPEWTRPLAHTRALR